MPPSAAQLGYRGPDAPMAPGPIARRWIEPLPYWLWCAIAFAPLVLTHLLFGGAISPFNPTVYYLFPMMQMIIIAVPIFAVIIAWLFLRLWLRRVIAANHGVNPDKLKPEVRRIVVALALVAAFFITGPLKLRLGAALRWRALESVRADVERGAGPVGGFHIVPFRFNGAELYTHGVVILYTEGVPGSFPGGGSGFIYVPEGVEFPAYNYGGGGHLLGRWYWFTTD